MPFRPFERQTTSGKPRAHDNELALRTLELSGEHGEARRRPLTDGWRKFGWAVLTALGVTAFVLGFFGARGSRWARLRDALHLFPSSFPGPAEPGDRAMLISARYIAAVVSLSVTLRLILGVYHRHLTAAAARRRSNHAVICGVGDKGSLAGLALLGHKTKVTAIDLDPDGDHAAELRRRGALVIEGDARRAEILSTAGINRARLVVCTCPDDADNAQIAVAVANRLASQRRARQGVDVHVHIGDVDAAHALRAPALGLVGTRMEFFNVHDRHAAALCESAGLAGWPDATLPQIVVVGRTPVSEALVVALGRQWHALRRANRLPIQLVAPDAADAISVLSERYPALPKVTALTPVTSDATSFELGLLGRSATSDESTIVLFVCSDSDADSLRIALGARQSLPPQTEVIVPASRGLQQQASAMLGVRSGVTFVSVDASPTSLDLLRDSARESMAMAIHRHYRAALHATEGARVAPADVDWEQLSPDLRESNRRHVDRIVTGLRSLWLEPALLRDWDEPPRALTSEQIDILAADEHSRWKAEHLAEGWQYGVLRDEGRRHHPYLVPWSQLSDGVRQIDLRLVSAWPQVLHDAGFRLEVSPEREMLARSLHEHYEPPTGNSIRSWYELSDAERELNRSAVDAIPRKLHAIGARLTASAGTPFTFSSAEIETLARMEHDRWCAVRREHGWTAAAARDDALRHHPDLVSWEELPESRRQIDRDHVTVLPSLLGSVGLGVERVE